MFSAVERTRIGSPYVVAAMEDVLNMDSAAKVIGYEANGGFLLGFEATTPTGTLAPLMTRDCLLPIIAPLVAAKARNQPISADVAALPARFTAADRLQGIATDASAQLLQNLTSDADARAAFFETGSAEQHIDTTDGPRVTFDNGDIIHLRPSGNAPEFRCYTEATSSKRAAQLLALHLSKLERLLG
jgi:phosphomannomutase